MVNMGPLEGWIDEYLRVIVRTRPWTKRREEEALGTFSKWMQSHARERDADLAVRGVALAERCADDLSLDREGRERLRSAVRGLTMWVRAEATSLAGTSRHLETE
jgi:hypothetical protein